MVSMHHHGAPASPGLQTTYPFPRPVKMELGATVAIWNSGAKAEHRPKD